MGEPVYSVAYSWLNVAPTIPGSLVASPAATHQRPQYHLLPPSVVETKNISRHFQMLLGAKLPPDETHWPNLTIQF